MNLNKKSISIGVLVVLLIAGGVYYFKKPTTPSLTNDPNAPEAQEEMLTLVAAVGELIDLPSGENPTIATITDPEKLKDQPFFVNAKAGYKVLIYPTARKAFLYDPSREKLVEVAPLILGDPTRLPESTDSSVSQ